MRIERDGQAQIDFNITAEEHGEFLEFENPYDDVLRGHGKLDVDGLMLADEPHDAGVVGRISPGEGDRPFVSANDYLFQATAKSERGAPQASRETRLKNIYADANKRLIQLRAKDGMTLHALAGFRDHEGSINELSDEEAQRFRDAVIDEETPVAHGFDVFIAATESSSISDQQKREILDRAAFALHTEMIDPYEIALLANTIDTLLSTRYRWWNQRIEEMGRAVSELLTE